MIFVCLIFLAAQAGHHQVSVHDLPKPYASASIKNIPVVVHSSKPAPLKAPAGFKINLFALGLQSPRWLLTAPNGDVFCAECYQGRISILRDTDGNGVSNQRYVFATGLNLPFGMALHSGYLYVANTNSVVRFAYQPGQTKASGKPEVIIRGIPSKGYNQHWTRNILFANGKLYLSVGSETNKSTDKPPRAMIYEYDKDGKNGHPFASGLRNPVGLAINPATGDLWSTVVERDFMGDDLVPDFLTSVHKGDFFGWPWYYTGNNRDPRVLNPPAKQVKIPETLFEAHSVPLGLVFYEGDMFPNRYRGDAFVAMRGSTNRKRRSGHKIVRVHFVEGKPTPGYEDFVTGWVIDETGPRVWGRPVGLTVWTDGSLLIADEGAHKIYRVSYEKDGKA